jgi:hypothetical protein
MTARFCRDESGSFDRKIAQNWCICAQLPQCGAPVVNRKYSAIGRGEHITSWLRPVISIG